MAATLKNLDHLSARRHIESALLAGDLRGPLADVQPCMRLAYRLRRELPVHKHLPFVIHSQLINLQRAEVRCS